MNLQLATPAHRAHTGAARETSPRRHARLSAAQRALWLLERVHRGSVANHLTYALRLGPVDPDRLAAALDRAVERHAMLRTTFPTVAGEPVMVVHDRRPVAFHVEEAHAWDGDRMTRWLDEETLRPFDLATGPLARFVLLRRDDGDVFVMSLHHLIADMWSIALLGHELGRLYLAEMGGPVWELPTLRASYLDAVADEEAFVASPAGLAHRAFWVGELLGAPTSVGLPTDRPRSADRSGRGATVGRLIDAATTRAVRDHATAAASTPFNLLLSVFQAVLHRTTGEDDLVVATLKANRSARTARVLGCFVNPVALRADLSGDPTFAELLARVDTRTAMAFAHDAYPLQCVVEETRPASEHATSPFLDVVYSWQKTTRLVDPALSSSLALARDDASTVVGGVSVDPLALTQRPTPFDFALLVAERDDELLVTFQYATDLFDPATIERFADHFANLLTAALTAPEQRIGDAAMLDSNELDEVLALGRGPVVAVDPTATVHSLVAARAAQQPERLAVRHGDDSLTYAELETRAERVARRLVDAGVQQNDVVGLHLQRSIDMVAAVLGVWKAGAAYLPLDPEFPPARLAFMVGDAGVRVVVSHSELEPIGTAHGHEPERLLIDLPGQARIEAVTGSQEPRSGDPLAYILYTSGSTGLPKGVQVEHRNLVNLFQAMAVHPGLTGRDVVVSVTTLSFDISVLELFLPLVEGAQVVIADRTTITDPRALGRLLDESGATMMQATPSTWRMLVDGGWAGRPELAVWCGGETLPPDLATRLLTTCAGLWNVYGPTETTVWSTAHEVEEVGSGPVPIGRPIANTRCYVLDARHQLVPVGVPGELWIGGAGVARGYVDRPDLDIARFVPDPFAELPGGRMYRTGDIVRWRADGSLEHLGRADHQVKIRGHRVELGEIEAVLASHPEVRAAVVTATDGGPDDVRLIAYTTPSGSVTPEALRAHLRATLPTHMVPSTFVALDELPLTPNQKVDRSRLPSPPLAARSTRPSGPPRPGLERAIADVWEKVLDVRPIGRDDDFFDLGGHSLLAVKIFTELERRTGRSLPLTSLFRAPTVAGLSELLERDTGVDGSFTSLVAVHPGGARAPLFYVSPYLITSLSFSHLARHLGPDQPLYVLQPQGLDSDHPIHEQVRDMAGHYVAEMRQVQPDGPYLLGGHCAGAWVAFEMARQLQAEGQQVGLLALVDSEAPGTPPPTRKAKSLAARVGYYRRSHRLVEAVAWQASVLYERYVLPHVGRDDRRRVARLRRIHAVAHRHYRAGTVIGDAVLIRSEESLRLPDSDWDEGWRPLLTGTLRVETVPGAHADLVTPDHAPALAARLRSALERSAV